MSVDEYQQKYDLSDQQVFAQQAEQLNNYEIVTSTMFLIFKHLDVTDYKEFNAKMVQAENEIVHFKEHLQNEVQNSWKNQKQSQES